MIVLDRPNYRVSRFLEETALALGEHLRAWGLTVAVKRENRSFRVVLTQGSTTTRVSVGAINENDTICIFIKDDLFDGGRRSVIKKLCARMWKGFPVGTRLANFVVNEVEDFEHASGDHSFRYYLKLHV